MSGDQYGDDAEILEISEDAVRAWVGAWREFASAMWSIENRAKMHSEIGGAWGDLDSIQQLEQIYRCHLGGGMPESLAGRIAEFCNEAERIAEQFESQFLALTVQDALTAQALESGDR